MTSEMAKVHGKVIGWWIENSDKGVWVQNYKSDKWYLSHKPAFIRFDTYVQNDKHAEARKWKADGKQLQRRTLWDDNCNFDKSWNDYDKSNTISTNHNGTEVEYRIKPNEPTFKVGDWVVHSQGNFLIKEMPNEDEIEFLSSCDNSVRIDACKLWKPTKGEWCVFWDNNDTSYYIDKVFGNINDSNPMDIDRCIYDNVAPLEFALTLKDK